MIALVFGLVFNFAMYWFSDKIAIATTRSKPVTEQEYPQLYRIVRELDAGRRHADAADLRLATWPQPNAFATGRSPDTRRWPSRRASCRSWTNASCAASSPTNSATCENRDILIGSIAAAIGMSITFLARFALFFGGGDDNRGGGFGVLAAWILAPIAAAIIQMAVSRSREYQADESGAYLSKDPDALASALRKLEVASKQVPPPAIGRARRGAHVHREPHGGAAGTAASATCSRRTRPPPSASPGSTRSPSSSGRLGVAEPALGAGRTVPRALRSGHRAEHGAHVVDRGARVHEAQTRHLLALP